MCSRFVPNRVVCYFACVKRCLILIALAGALTAPPPAAADSAPATAVRIVPAGDGWRLERGGRPFFIKGVVGSDRLDLLKASGGNAIRTGPAGLDRAHKQGLVCLVGLPLGKPRQGFDYADPARVREQFARVRQIVRQHRDHPALLMWALGNEPEIHTSPEQRARLWREVNRLAAMVKAEDPHHPVITVIGDAYKRILHELEAQCPALDAIGLNAYVDMLTLPADVARQGWKRPYVVTEFGPRGHWQVSKTTWGVPIEDTSTAKAAFYRRAYEAAVAGQPACLGAFAFYWAHKQEKTHTWYGLFLPDGSRTAAIDTMRFLWTGQWPANRCPEISRIRCLESPPEQATEPPTLFAGRTVAFAVEAGDPDEDTLRVSWDLRVDVADNPSVGGDPEPPTPPIEGAIAVTSREGREVQVRLPFQPGKYRLFVYAHDDHGGAATANLPLLVVTAR